MADNTMIMAEAPVPAPALRKTADRGNGGTWGLLVRITQNMFGLDYRSLAFLRIGIALCLMWVTLTHGHYMRIFYTDEGVLSRQALFDSSGGFTGISIYFANGSMPFVATMFVIQFILAFMMLVGYRTRLATVGSYLFLISLQNRHPVLVYGADNVLRVGLFWMMFMPLAKRFSVDRLTGRTGPPPEGVYVGIAGMAFMVQFASIYTGGVLMKVGDSWQVNHDAVAYALALDVYTRPMGKWLGSFPMLTHALTYVTLYAEFYGPALLFLPVLSKWGRMLGFLIYLGLQVGFGMCMYLEYFGPAMIALSLVFLPAMFWERMPGRRLAARAGERLALPGSGWIAALWRSWVERERVRASGAGGRSLLAARVAGYAGIVLAWARDAGLAFLVVVLLLWNWGNVPVREFKIPRGVNPFGFAIGLPRTPELPKPQSNPTLNNLIITLGLDQCWDMFSANPQRIDGWFVVAGVMANGDSVNLISGERPVSYDWPASVGGSYRNRLWMGYLISFWYEGSSDPEAFAIYLGNEWNQTHTGEERIKTVEIDAMVYWVTPGPEKTEVSREMVWEEWFP